MIDLMSTEGAVAHSALQSHMVMTKPGSMRQPLLGRLFGGITESPIMLAKLTKGHTSNSPTMNLNLESINSIYL